MFQQMGGKAVAKAVGCNIFPDICSCYSGTKNFLNAGSAVLSALLPFKKPDLRPVFLMGTSKNYLLLRTAAKRDNSVAKQNLSSM